MPLATCMSGMNFVVVGEGPQGRKASDWTRWIEMRGGHMHNEVKPDTTHIIINNSNAFDKRSSIIKQALARRSIQLVTTDWMEAFIRANAPPGGKSIPPEHNFRQQAGKLLLKQERERKKQEQQKQKETKARQKALEKKKKEKAKAAAAATKKRSRSALCQELEDHTAEHAPAAKQPKLSRPKTGLLAKEVQKRDERAKVAKYDLLSDCHIYTDSTGFEYDITLTKTNTEFNYNQTLYIRFYESSIDPKSYAVTKTLTGEYVTEKSVELLAPTGSTFPVANRMFKKAFKDATGVMWEDRMNFPRFREIHREQAPEGQIDNLIAPRPRSAAPSARLKSSNNSMNDFKKQAFLSAAFRWRAPPEGCPEGAMGPSSSFAGHSDERDQGTPRDIDHDIPNKSIDYTTNADYQEETEVREGAESSDLAAGGSVVDDVSRPPDGAETADGRTMMQV